MPAKIWLKTLVVSIVFLTLIKYMIVREQNRACASTYINHTYINDTYTKVGGGKLNLSWTPTYIH